MSVLKDATFNDAEDITTHAFTLAINQVGDAPGLSIDAKLLFLSPELQREHLRVRALHSFPADADVVVSLAIKIASESIDEVQAQFQEVKEMVQAMLPDPEMISLVIEGQLFCIGLNLSMITRGENIIKQHADIIAKIQEELKVDQNLELSIRLATSLKKLLAENGEPFLAQLLKGTSLSVRLNVWRKMSDVIMKVIESSDFDASLLPIFGGIAPAFLLRLNAKLELTVDEAMVAKLSENPLIAPLLMDAGSLIGATSNVASDEEFDSHIENLKTIPPPIAKLMGILVAQMGDEVTLSASHPQLGMLLRLNGEGLALILKTFVKYLPRSSSE